MLVRFILHSIFPGGAGSPVGSVGWIVDSVLNPCPMIYMSERYFDCMDGTRIDVVPLDKLGSMY